jgi:PhnB protein
VTTIAPWLSVPSVTEAIAFYGAAFGAIELERSELPDGTVIVSQLSIDGAAFWVQADPDSSPAAVNGMSVRMILEVDDPAAMFARAIAAGAFEIYPVSDGHGWNIGRVADPSGHHWEIGARLPS